MKVRYGHDLKACRFFIRTKQPRPVQTLVRLVRTDSGFDRKELVDVRFVPALPGIAREL